tara:strand:+ start:2556 stop:3962 length:1407 start_codon:yes stop_codon:yes gene_type:complete
MKITDIILKYFFYISLGITTVFIGWLIDHVNVKTDQFDFINFGFYLKILIIIFFLLVLIKYKKKFIIVFFFLYLLGSSIYQSNYLDINDKLILVLKQTIFKVSFVNKVKNVFTIGQEIKQLKIDDLVYSEEFEGQIIIRKDGFENVYVLDTKKNILYKIFDSVSKNDKILPIYIKKINDLEYEFLYYNLSTLIKTKLDTKFKLKEVVWKKDFNFYFHHWGDVFDNKLFIPTSRPRSYPIKYQKKFINNFKNCNDSIFPYETVDVFNLQDGSHIKTYNLFENLWKIKELNIKQYNFQCNDPLHLNDVRVIKNIDDNNNFSNSNIGDIYVSFASLDLIALYDQENEIKNYFVGGMVRQHSPRLMNSNKILIFDNLGSDRIFGKSRIVSFDTQTKNLSGIYEGDIQNFFESRIAGRLQIYDNKIYVNSSTESKLFELNCEEISILKNCLRKNILSIPNLSGETFLLEVIEN